MAVMSARGMVRAGRATSPLALREISIPVKANTARIIARPKPGTEGGAAAARFARFSAIAPATMNTKSGTSLTAVRSEEHTSELQSQSNLVCRLLLEKKKTKNYTIH